MSEFNLKNDNQPNVKFDGGQIANVSDKQVYNDGGRWNVVKIFKTKGGKYVGQRIGRTCLDGEVDRYAVKVCDTEAELTQFLGFSNLAKDAYAEAGIDASVCID